MGYIDIRSEMRCKPVGLGCAVLPPDKSGGYVGETPTEFQEGSQQRWGYIDSD